jgi:hypothetical protein
MNKPFSFDNSGVYPVYLNWETSAAKYRLSDEPGARPADFSCYVYEFTLYQEPPKAAQAVIYK